MDAYNFCTDVYKSAHVCLLKATLDINVNVKNHISWDHPITTQIYICRFQSHAFIRINAELRLLAN